MAVLANENVIIDYQEKSIPSSKIKYRKRTITMQEKLFYIFSIFIVVGLASIVISGYAIIAENNYKVQELKKSIAKINQETENLEMEIAELSSPSRILKIAYEELGMTLDESRIIVLSGN